jgi:hypothetical protein
VRAGLFVGTTAADDWLDRVAVTACRRGHRLGRRAHDGVVL